MFVNNRPDSLLMLATAVFSCSSFLSRPVTISSILLFASTRAVIHEPDTVCLIRHHSNTLRETSL